MKITKTKTHFIAMCTVDNELGTRGKVGDIIGKISIKTGKFVGVANVELLEEYLNYKDTTDNILYTKVFEQLKIDISSGNTKSVFELFECIPKPCLEDYLTK